MYKTSGTYFSTSCKSVSLNSIVQHINQNTQIIGLKNGDFLGGPVVKISPSSEGNASSIPGQFGSVQSLIVSDSLPPHGLQHTRLSCPSPTPRACSNSCPLSWLCHPTISSSVVPFSSCLQSFPASGFFQMSQFFASGGQSGFSFSISPSSEYSGPISFRTHWFDLLAVQGTLESLLQHHSSKASMLQCSAFFMVQLSYPYVTTGKTIALTRWTFVGKVMSLLFNMLSRLVITFLQRSKRLLISWPQ